MVALRQDDDQQPEEEEEMVAAVPLRHRRLAELAALAVAGRLTPDAVVTAAKQSESALHSWFEWDDAAAADAYRIDQARTLIASFRIEVVRKTVTINAIAYTRDPTATAREQGYRGIEAISARSEWAQATLDAELQRVEGSVNRFRLVAESLGLKDDGNRRLRTLLG